MKEGFWAYIYFFLCIVASQKGASFTELALRASTMETAHISQTLSDWGDSGTH